MRRRARKNKCLSCRKLKIRCDEAKPSCEYCGATNRECVYDEISNSPDLHVEKETIVWYRQMSINSPLKHMDLSNFEFKLLKYFHEVHLSSVELKQPPLKNMWQVQVPTLFFKSPLIRSSIFSLSSLLLWNLCDISSWIYDVNDTYEIKYMRLGSLDKQRRVPNVSLNLQEKTEKYYHQTLQMTLQATGEGKTPVTVDEAAEIVLSSLLLFSFFALHSHRLIPLMSSNDSEPDFFRILQGMGQAMSGAWPLLFESRFSALFYKNEVITPPTIKKLYPVVIYLRSELESHYSQGEIASLQYEDFVHALDTMDVAICSSVNQSFPMSIYKWIFLIRDEIYGYAKRDRHHFALQLIYVGCCMNLVTKFYLKQHSNMWIEYVDWYKEYCTELFGGWKDDFDRRFYDIVLSGYIFPADQYSSLETFFP